MTAGSPAPSSSTPALRRVVTRWELVGIAINDVIGSGVYLLPAAAALLLGPASVWALLLAGFAVLLLVLCFAEAASHFDEPGSGYLSTREAFGRFVPAWASALGVSFFSAFAEDPWSCAWTG